MGDFRSLALNGRSPIGGLGGFLARIDDTPFDLETIGHQAIGPYSTDRWRDASIRGTVTVSGGANASSS
jgi:hypothetical protein